MVCGSWLKAHDPCLKAPADGVIKMDYLGKTMHPGVGAAGAGRPHFLPGYLLKSILQRLLRRRDTQVGLRLPAVIMAAVVLNSGRDASARRQWRIRQAQGLRTPLTAIAARELPPAAAGLPP